jgi:hypothetical protein
VIYKRQCCRSFTLNSTVLILSALARLNSHGGEILEALRKDISWKARQPARSLERVEVGDVIAVWMVGREWLCCCSRLSILGKYTEVYRLQRLTFFETISTTPYFTMSDAVKEFVEVPRQFVKEGTQASSCSHNRISADHSTRHNSSSTGVPSPHKRVSRYTSHLLLVLMNPPRLPHRIHSAMPSRRCWIRSHGIHRILCQAYSHPNVSVFVIIIIRLNADRCCSFFSNNILV